MIKTIFALVAVMALVASATSPHELGSYAQARFARATTAHFENIVPELSLGEQMMSSLEVPSINMPSAAFTAGSLPFEVAPAVAALKSLGKSERVTTECQDAYLAAAAVLAEPLCQNLEGSDTDGEEFTPEDLAEVCSTCLTPLLAQFDIIAAANCSAEDLGETSGSEFTLDDLKLLIFGVRVANLQSCSIDPSTGFNCAFTAKRVGGLFSDSDPEAPVNVPVLGEFCSYCAGAFQDGVDAILAGTYLPANVGEAAAGLMGIGFGIDMACTTTPGPNPALCYPRLVNLGNALNALDNGGDAPTDGVFEAFCGPCAEAYRALFATIPEAGMDGVLDIVCLADVDGDLCFPAFLGAAGAFDGSRPFTTEDAEALCGGCLADLSAALSLDNTGTGPSFEDIVCLQVNGEYCLPSLATLTAVFDNDATITTDDLNVFCDTNAGSCFESLVALMNPLAEGQITALRTLFCSVDDNGNYCFPAFAGMEAALRGDVSDTATLDSLCGGCFAALRTSIEAANPGQLTQTDSDAFNALASLVCVKVGTEYCIDDFTDALAVLETLDSQAPTSAGLDTVCASECVTAMIRQMFSFIPPGSEDGTNLALVFNLVCMTEPSGDETVYCAVELAAIAALGDSDAAFIRACATNCLARIQALVVAFAPPGEGIRPSQSGIYTSTPAPSNGEIDLAKFVPFAVYCNKNDATPPELCLLVVRDALAAPESNVGFYCPEDATECSLACTGALEAFFTATGCCGANIVQILGMETGNTNVVDYITESCGVTIPAVCPGFADLVRRFTYDNVVCGAYTEANLLLDCAATFGVPVDRCAVTVVSDCETRDTGALLVEFTVTYDSEEAAAAAAATTFVGVPAGSSRDPNFAANGITMDQAPMEEEEEEEESAAVIAAAPLAFTILAALLALIF